MGRSVETFSVINGNSDAHLDQSSDFCGVSVDLGAEQGHDADQMSGLLIMRRNETLN